MKVHVQKGIFVELFDAIILKLLILPMSDGISILIFMHVNKENYIFSI